MNRPVPRYRKEAQGNKMMRNIRKNILYIVYVSGHVGFHELNFNMDISIC